VLVKDQYDHLLPGALVTLFLGSSPNQGMIALAGSTGTSDTNGLATFPGLSINLAGAGYTVVATSGQALPAVSNPFTVAPTQAAVSLGNLTAVYDGTPKPVSVTTVPAGLGVSVTYNGSTVPPFGVGTYDVTAMVTDPDYVGTATGTLVISAPVPLLVNVPGTAGGTENYNVSGGPAAALGTPPVNTGLFLNAGSQVTVSATGHVSWYGPGLGAASPDGALPWQSDFLAPAPLAGISLIARIGTGPWQLVGAGPTTLTAAVAGTLQFAINDSYYGDNAGAFAVSVTLVPTGIVTSARAGGSGGTPVGPAEVATEGIATATRLTPGPVLQR
jgi:hypothetical protein